MGEREDSRVRALLLVDIQKDFCEGGSLAVEGGNATVPVANRLRREGSFEGRVFLTQDWHPDSHVSFASVSGKQPFSSISLKHPHQDDVEYQQTVWPDHCVQGSEGAEWHKDLVVEESDVVVSKGTDVGADSYSGFFDNHQANQTELDSKLRAAGVTELCIVGIATDVCIHFTVMDAVEHCGYDVVVVKEGCAGIDPDASEKCIALWKSKGVTVVDDVDAYLSLKQINK